MRNLLFLAGALLVFACSNDENMGTPDLAASTDMPIKVDAALAACDVIKQDCPAGQKCTVLQTGTGQNASFASGCIASDANIAAGMPCVRNNDTVGDDACAKGLFCTGVGYPVDSAGNPVRHCNALCAADATCGTGQKCETLTDAGDAGLCVAACDPAVQQHLRQRVDLHRVPAGHRLDSAELRHLRDLPQHRRRPGRRRLQRRHRLRGERRLR